MKPLLAACAAAALLPISQPFLGGAEAAPPMASEAPIVMAPFEVRGNSAEHAGISLQVIGRWNKTRTGVVIDEPTVAHVFPGSPAQRAGIAKGDILTQIGDIKTKGLEMRRWHEIFDYRHATGETATFLIRKAGTQKTIPLTFRFVARPAGTASAPTR